MNNLGGEQAPRRKPPSHLDLNSLYSKTTSHLSSLVKSVPCYTPFISALLTLRTLQYQIAMSIVPPAFLSLQPTSSSFPFQAKFIPIQGNMRITIGAQALDAPGRPARRAAPTNGTFPPAPSSTGSLVLPITLDTRHIEAWIGANNIVSAPLPSSRSSPY